MTLYSCTDSSFDNQAYLFLFPNLKEIRIRPIRYLGDQQSPIEDRFNNDDSLLESRIPKHLRHIEDFGECKLTLLLTSYKLCHELATLELELSSDIFSLSKDMPVLKNLIIRYFNIGIDTLEVIHKNIPSLESLEILNADLIPGPLPEHEIIPVTKFNYLKVIGNGYIACSNKDRLDLHRYIHEKYPNLKHLILRNSIGGNNVYGFPLHKIQLETMGLAANRHEDFEILRNLDIYGNQRKEFQLSNVAEGIFEDLAITKPFNLIKKLTLHKLEGFIALDNFYEMKKLEYLDLDYLEYDMDSYFSDDENVEDMEETRELFMQQVSIDLIELLDSIPKTVESLAIRNAYLNYPFLERVYGHFKKLTLDNIKPQKKNLRFYK